MFQFILYLSCYIALWNLEGVASFLKINSFFQLFIFLMVAHLPSLKNKRMSYVDIAWPLGLVAIAISAIVTGEGNSIKKMSISVPYLISGLRMSGMALLGLKQGFFRREFPRYRYHVEKWKNSGVKRILVKMQFEISLQCFANMSLLSLPALLIASNLQSDTSWLERFGYLFWFFSAALEMLADLQKYRFSQNTENNSATCDKGLWKYSRHPNYFFQWMQWNALILCSLPSLIFKLEHGASVPLMVIAVALLGISPLIYYVLVYYTGAIPSEFYSLRKRLQYSVYKERTNRFFPFPRKGSHSNRCSY